MTDDEYDHWYVRATELFPPVVVLFDKKQAKHKDWRHCLEPETLGDCLRILDDMHRGKIDSPQYVAEWWRLPSIVRVHASQMRLDRDKWRNHAERHTRTGGNDERGKSIGDGIASTIASLGDGAADIYVRACQLMRDEGKSSKESCNQAAEELEVKWWEPI